MLFNSVQFIVFFPLVLIVYFVIPRKFKNIWLLIASYFYYMCWNARYIILILASTAITYASGLLIDKVNVRDVDEHSKRKIKNFVVAASFVLNIGLLFVYKYLDLACDIINRVSAMTGINIIVPPPHLLLPVGISFYIFQALSYTMDVYRGDIYAEKNIIQYALFVSFFPQLVAGPIERSKNLLKQLAVPHSFSFDDLREGTLLMLWGYFMKLVIADRLALFVDTVYGDYMQYPGYYIAVAAVLFLFQIYCDFAGYSTIAMGAAYILGIRLTDNFNAPLLSGSVAEFWRKWHISLMSWFKDYLYIPLGGGRVGKVRKYINIMLVFLISGLWHGASLTYVVWGAVNGLYWVLGDLIKPVRRAAVKRFAINGELFGSKALCAIITFVLIAFTFIFFRAPTMGDAVHILGQLFSVNNIWILFDGSLFECGLDKNGFQLVTVMIAILTVADLCKRRGIVIREHILRQDRWFRCVFISLAVLFIMTFGVYGPAYASGAFIYFQF